MSNVYLLGQRGGRWVLVDTGTPGMSARIRRAAHFCYGDRAPEAIVLTHGHFDHTGNVRELADYWDVPVYSHPMEAPYLDGRDHYPPPDPTVGGFMAQLSRVFPKCGVELGSRLRQLNANSGEMPGLEGWKVIHTPGHTPGHISLFRSEDRVLIAGDAVITINQQNPIGMVTQERRIYPPPTYFTTDWDEAADSIRKLSDLGPALIAAGHGLPLMGAGVPGMLEDFASTFQPPAQGRYVESPALADGQGFYYVPPKPRDRAGWYAAGIAVAAVGLVALAMRQRGESGEERYPKAMPGHLLYPGD